MRYIIIYKPKNRPDLVEEIFGEEFAILQNGKVAEIDVGGSFPVANQEDYEVWVHIATSEYATRYVRRAENGAVLFKDIVNKKHEDKQNGTH